MKTIKKDGFVFRTSFFFTEYPPEQVNLCDLILRFPLGLIIVPLFYIVFALVIAILFLVGSFFGHRPSILEDDPPDLFVSYQKWLTVRGQRIYPAAVLGLAGLTFGLVWGLVWLAGKLDVILGFFVSHTTLMIVGGLIVLTLAVAGLWRFFRSETGKLFRDWLKAVKGRFCPIYQVVGDEP